MAYLAGNSLANQLTGTAAADTLVGRGGNDKLDGGGGNDKLNGGRGNDILSGGGGNDTFQFLRGDGQDIVTDFAAGDLIRISGYAAAQSLVQSGTSVVLTLSATDKITFSNATLAAVQAALNIGTGTGGGGGGGTPGVTITGTSGWDKLVGTTGNDTIYGLDGYDEIRGGGGNDRIYGGLRGDGLWGGAGADVFVYTSLDDGPGFGLAYYENDWVRDFEAIDRIDLSAIDANPLVAGQQHFRFAGITNGSTTPADKSPGALYLANDGTYAWVFAYTDNSGYPTFVIDLSGGATPTAANLIF